MRRPYPWNIRWEKFYFATEKQIWDYLHDPTTEISVRQERAKRFEAEFSRVISRLPPGKNIETKIRKLLKLHPDGNYYIPWTPRSYRRAYVELSDAHPRAIPFIEKYGVLQKPHVWEKPLPIGYPENGGEPGHNDCYHNARLFMLVMNMVNGKTPKLGEIGYSEGITFGTCGAAILHGWNWNSRKPDIAIDWSQYASAAYSAYLGISFTAREYKKVMKIIHGPDHSGSIFHNDYFTRRAENFIRDLLEERKRKQRQQEQEVCKEAAD